MKRFVLVAVIITILLLAAIIALNFFGIISLRSYAEDILFGLPFLENYLKTGEDYKLLQEEHKSLKSDYENVEQEHSKLETDYEELLEEHENLQAEFAELDEMYSELNQNDMNQEERLQKLVDIYSSMDANQSAEIFETMNKDLAVAILGKMEDRDAAQLLENLQAELAAELSAELR